jgi:hypothetical protein
MRRIGRHIMATLVMALVTTSSGPAMAATPSGDLATFIGYVRQQDIPMLIERTRTILNDPAYRMALGASIREREFALLALLPDACWLPAYITYWQYLTLADKALWLLDHTERQAADRVFDDVVARGALIDADTLAACAADIEPVDPYAPMGPYVP